MNSNSTEELLTRKRGWLSVQKPDKKHPKDYFVLLLPDALECYKNTADANRGSQRAVIRLQLRNCILIQSLKKEKLKNGFSLLIVPDGLFVMSAVSETEKSSWLEEIRDTIGNQLKRDLEMDGSTERGSQRERKKSAGEVSDKPTHRSRLRLGRHKQQGSSADDLDRRESDKSSNSLLRGFRNSGYKGSLVDRPVASSAVSLQNRRPLAPDGLGRTSRSNTPISSVDLRGSRSRRSGLVETTLQKPISGAPPQQISKPSDGLRATAFNHSPSPQDALASEHLMHDVTAKNHGEQKRLNESISRGSVLSDRASLSMQSRSKQESSRLSKVADADAPPQPTRPLVWSVTDKNASHSSGNDNYTKTKIPANQQMDRTSNSTVVNSPKQKTANPNEPTSNRGSLTVVTVNNKGGSGSPNELSVASNNTTSKSTSKITILRPNEPTILSQRCIVPPQELHSIQLGTKPMKPIMEVDITGKKTQDEEVKFTNTGISPENPSLPRGRKTASFYRVNRRDMNAEPINRPITINPTYRQPTHDALYLENQKLRDQIRALTTTNFELEAKMNFVGQRSHPMGSRPAEKVNAMEHEYLPTTGQPDRGANDFDSSNGPRVIEIPVDQKRCASVEPDYVSPKERVESWLLKSTDPMNNGPFMKKPRSPNSRKHHSKSRRNTTNDIPDPETIYALSNMHNGMRTQSNFHAIEIDRTQLNSFSPQDQLRNRNMSASLNAFNQPYGSSEAMRSKNNLQSERPPSRLLTPSIPEPIDPRYASSMWCRLVDLWSNLLNEERAFWKGQLQQLFSQSLNYQFSNDQNNILKVLDNVNRQHTEETVNLWKHIYESWIPRDYLDFFSDETRKIMVCLHSVIDTLFNMVDEMRSGGIRPEINQQIDHLKQQLVQVRALDELEMENDDSKRTVTANCESINILNRQDANGPSAEKSLASQISVNPWYQTKALLKQSHSELLNQVYNVAELVGAALDAEMEDNIRTAKTRGDYNVTPLTALPRSGLQAAAKLQSLVLDLESRLDAVDQHEIFNDQTYSQPVLAVNATPITEKVHPFSEADQRITLEHESHRVLEPHELVNGFSVDKNENNIGNNDDGELDPDDDDDEDTYVGLNSVISTGSQDKPAYTLLTTTKVANPDGTPKKDSPVILVLQDNRENELYRKNAEIMNPQYTSNYAESDVISITTARHDSRRQANHNWRLGKQ